MTILTLEEREALRKLYEFDLQQGEVLDKFFTKWKMKILKDPLRKSTEWEMISSALEKESQVTGIDQMKIQFEEEVANVGVKDGR